MFTEAVTAGETRPASPGRKRTKIAEVKHSGSKQYVTPKVVHISEEGDVAAMEPPKRQYLTRSRAAATTRLGQQEKQKSKAPNVLGKHEKFKAPVVADLMLQSSSGDSAPTSSLSFPNLFHCIMDLYLIWRLSPCYLYCYVLVTQQYVLSLKS
jgi:hypothetical protein